MKNKIKGTSLFKDSSNKSKPFGVKFYNNENKRTQRNFKTRSEAESFIRSISTEEKMPEDIKISPELRLQFISLQSQMKLAGLTFNDLFNIVAKAAEDKLADSVSKNIATQDAIDKYLDYCEQIKKVRPATVRNYKANLSLLSNRPLRMSIDEAKQILNSAKSPKVILTAAKTFYKWCMENKYAVINPFDNLSITLPQRDKEPPSILTPKQTEMILSNTPDIWCPTIALMCFAGIRPEEIISEHKPDALKIGDINFKDKKITIRGTVSKNRKFRILHDLPANLWTFLEPLKKIKDKNRLVAPQSYETYHRLRNQLSKEITPLPKDVFRHSFGSYGYYHLGIERTIDIMGHISGYGVFSKHYKGLSSEAASKEYFSITPTHPKK